MDENKSIPLVDAVIELGLVRMPIMVGESADEPYRPRLCMSVDQRSGMVLHFAISEPLEDYLPLALDCIAKAGDRVGGLPRQVQVRDPQLASSLRAPLERFGAEVVVRESLVALDEALASMEQFGRTGGGKREPALVHGKDITLDHLIGFAEAGQLFYQARPWRHLLDEDLIEIASPPGPAGTRMTQVLGAGGQTFGLGFVPSREAHEKMTADGDVPRGGIWSLLYYELDGLPFDDGEAFERHNLPVAGPEAYPLFCRFGKSGPPKFPSAAELAWGEGLLRALAATTEAEMDSGRWSKHVDTSAGRMTFELSLPLLLEALSGQTPDDARTLFARMTLQMEKMLLDSGDSTEAERAQDLCYEALQSVGRRQVQLARQALELDPDCCDAMLILAQRQNDSREALPLLEEAVKSGERKLGPQIFEEDAGHFWGLLETRPYMRARRALAEALVQIDQLDRAAEHLRDLLRLNPGDNQGNRYLLAQALLKGNQLEELEALLNHPDNVADASAEWGFTRALLAFRRHGDSPEARRVLDEAHGQNPHVSALLMGRLPMPAFSPDAYFPRSIEEAVLCAESIGAAWQETPGAVEWLTAAQPKTTGSRARGKAKKPRAVKGKRRKTDK